MPNQNEGLEVPLMFEELEFAAALEFAFKRVRRSSNRTARKSFIALLALPSVYERRRKLGSTSEPSRTAMSEEEMVARVPSDVP